MVKQDGRPSSLQDKSTGQDKIRKMTKLNKLKSGLVGLILLGTSSIANAETIKIGNDKITYHNFGCII